MGTSFGGYESDDDYNNPAEYALPYLQSVPNTITPYYQPYIDWGMESGDNLSNYYGSLIGDPTSYYNDIMSQYSASPQYNYQSDQLQQNMSGNAAAGGFTGTNYDQNQQADEVQKLIQRDQQQYFNNIFGIQNTGAQGEQHMFDTGYTASSTLADELATNLAQQSGLVYKGVADENKWKEDADAASGKKKAQMAGMASKIAMVAMLA